MIDVKELKYGNYVLLKSSMECQIVNGTNHLAGLVHLIGNGVWNNEDQIDPISLSPKVLKSCGFVDPAGNDKAFRLNVNSQDELCWYVQDGYLRWQTKGSGFTRSLEHIKYLHQLQGLYCSLTGQELTFKHFV